MEANMEEGLREHRGKPVVLAALFVLIVASGCPGGLDTYDCGEIRFRCAHNTMQLCNASGDWELYQDCGSVGETCTNIPANCGGYAGPCCA